MEGRATFWGGQPVRLPAVDLLGCFTGLKLRDRPLCSFADVQAEILQFRPPRRFISSRPKSRTQLRDSSCEENFPYFSPQCAADEAVLPPEMWSLTRRRAPKLLVDQASERKRPFRELTADEFYFKDEDDNGAETLPLCNACHAPGPSEELYFHEDGGTVKDEGHVGKSVITSSAFSASRRVKELGCWDIPAVVEVPCSLSGDAALRLSSVSRELLPVAPLDLVGLKSARKGLVPGGGVRDPQLIGTVSGIGPPFAAINDGAVSVCKGFKDRRDEFNGEPAVVDNGLDLLAATGYSPPLLIRESLQSSLDASLNLSLLAATRNE